MTGRRVAGIGVQVLALVGVVWFLVHTTREHWGVVASVRLVPAPGPLLAASLLTVATYVGLVRLWVASLGWWGAALPMREALRIWFLTNLARFVPGGVWQLAGMTAMAVSHGVSPVAATGAVLMQQVVLLATGLTVALALAPRFLGIGAEVGPPGLWLLLALSGLVALAGLLPAALPVVGRLLERLVRRPFAWPRPPARAFAGYVTALVLPWLTYGVAFWLFGRAFLGPSAPGLALAVGAFTASYVAGILVVVAPGGIVVREAALVAALAPDVGSQAALFLAFGSRLWLVLLEVATALVVVATSRAPRGTRT